MFPEIKNASEIRNIVVYVSGIPKIVNLSFGVNLHPFSHSDLTVQI